MKHKHTTHLYLYEGCRKHGCKIGVATKRSLAGRLVSCRRRCPASPEFAHVWELPNANQIEQFVVGHFSERRAPPGEEWFHVLREEMIDCVGFALETYHHDRYNRPRRYRTWCGHVWQEAE